MQFSKISKTSTIDRNAMALPSFPAGGVIEVVAVSNVQGHFCKPTLQWQPPHCPLIVHLYKVVDCSPPCNARQPGTCQHNAVNTTVRAPILVQFVSCEVFARRHPQPVPDPSFPPETASPVFLKVSSLLSSIAKARCPKSNVQYVVFIIKCSTLNFKWHALQPMSNAKR